MNSHIISRLATVLAAAAALVGLAGCGSSDVTKARLERNLPQTFANRYVQQAALLGHKGISVQSLHARASCDKGGAKVADHGPGADWICLMNWKDPNVPLPDGYGKFEINAHSNDCYTAGGPSKLVGLQTITDTHGNDAANPVFEFDSCFDPHTSNAATGVAFASPTPAAAGASSAPSPAVMTLQSTSLTLDRNGRITPTVACSSGDAGCAGTLIAKRGQQTLGAATYALAPGKTDTVPLALARRFAGGTIALTATPVIGRSPGSPIAVTVTGG